MRIVGYFGDALRWRRILRVVTWVAAFSFAVLFLAFQTGDAGILPPVEFAARNHRFSIAAWELENFMAKWLYRVESALPWSDPETQGYQALQRYIDLSTDAERIRAEMRNPVADTSHAELQERLREIEGEISSYKAEAEEFVEAEISRTIADEGFGIGQFLWPPTDFSFESGLLVIAVSPRDRVSLKQAFLVEPGTEVDEIEQLERSIFETENLSSVVLRSGGVATYPAWVNANRGLLSLLETASHEWLHGYLFFKPLGRGYFAGGRIVEINEVLAQVFGTEIGRITYNRITGQNIPTLAPPQEALPEDSLPGDDPFSEFFGFMRETRVRTDALLEEGRIEEAEAYMGARRVLLEEEQGIRIRKLNQAYFAFTGNYSSTGGSVSDVPARIWTVRQANDTIGDTVRFLEGIASPEEFDDLLGE